MNNFTGRGRNILDIYCGVRKARPLPYFTKKN
nr:MAG TPA: Methyltransferase domain [Microviridae sp.]